LSIRIGAGTLPSPPIRSFDMAARRTVWPSDPRDAALLKLAVLGIVQDWEAELAQLPELLELAPERLREVAIPVTVRSGVLYAAILELKKDAYNSFTRKKATEQEKLKAGNILAAASDIGFVTETHEQYEERARTGNHKPARSDKRNIRLGIAVSWTARPWISQRQYVRKYEFDNLTSFREALTKVLCDDENLEKFLAEQGHIIAPEPEAIQPAVNLVAAQSSALTDTIADLLRAQVAAAEHLPYWPFDPDMPTLREVYVETSLEPMDARNGDSDLLSLDDALARYRHIVVTGDGGVGKSTLVRYAVGRLSEAALGLDPSDRQLWLPLYIPARLMVGPTGFTESLFGEPPACLAGWLLFIDGIDEIVSSKELNRLLAYIGRHMRDGQVFRFVVMTRNLRDSQLEILEGPHVKLYKILPFDLNQLTEFVRKWAKARVPKRDEYDDGYIDDDHIAAVARMIGLPSKVPVAPRIMRIPLFAAVTMITFDQHQTFWSWRLPVVCEEFVTYALHRRQMETQFRAQIIHSFSVAGALGDQFAEWLYGNRRPMLSYLAHQMLEGKSQNLNEIAVEWIHKSYSEAVPAFPNWRKIIDTVLLDTGLIVNQGAHLVFLHRTLAEFIAAPLAGLPGAVEQSRAWTKREIDRGREQYLLFRILNWAYSNNIVPLVHELLTDSKCCSIVYGLLREGVELDREMNDYCIKLCVDELDKVSKSEQARFNYAPWSEILKILQITCDKAHPDRIIY
jgi:GTPase SAR1 family protein